MMRIIPLLLALLMGTVHSAEAASGAWIGAGDGNWNDDSNWTRAPYPGPGETATFDVEATESTLSMNGAAISLAAISFVGGPGSYTFNADGGSLSVARITVDANVTGTWTQTFNARLDYPDGGNSFITNDSAATVLDLQGGIDNASATKNLQFYVDGPGVVVLNGASSNHGAAISITKRNTGKLIYRGTSSGAVSLTEHGGIVQFDTAGAMNFSGNGIGMTGGIIGLGAEDFTLALATGGANTIRWSTTVNGDTGFAAYGANRSVNIGGEYTDFVWGGHLQIKEGVGLVLGSADSTHTLDFQNQLDLADGARSIVVHDGTSPTNIDGEISGVISSPTAPQGSVTKTGAGTLLLSAGNLYTGLTTVSAGTLLVGNSSGQGSLYGGASVASGAILGGSGSIAGVVTIDGSLHPGNGMGILTVQDGVTWNGGNAWVFELGAAAATHTNAGGGSQDQLQITSGDFLKGTGSAWAFDFAGTGAVGWYKIVDWTGTSNFQAGDFTASNLGAGLSGAFIVDGGTSALYLKVDRSSAK